MRQTSDSSAATAVHLRALLEQSSELGRLLLKSTQPPRELVSRTLHGRKRLSAEDRQFVSSAAHHALRCWRFARACVIGSSGNVGLRPPAAECFAVTAAATLLAHGGFLPDPSLTDLPGVDEALLEEASAFLLREHAAMTPDDLRERALLLDARARELSSAADAGPDADRVATAARIIDERDARHAVAVRASLPDWVVRSWREQRDPMSFAAILDIGMSLCVPPPLTLRVNRLRCDRASLLRALAEHDLAAHPHPVLPDAVRLAQRVQLLETAWHAEGLFEVQDAGSQLIPLACAAKEGMAVLDACAGGGGKTIQLADLLGDTGSILACDIERSKLRGLEQRARRLGLQSVRTQLVPPTASGDLSIAEAAYDVVLVDAPCSGFGTVRRNPAHKWRLAEKTVTRLAVRQEEILARYATALRPGGSLVYATCSLLPQENSNIVTDFLETHPSFHPAPLAPAIPFASDDGHTLLIQPDLLDSDGFFVARMTADR